MTTLDLNRRQALRGIGVGLLHSSTLASLSFSTDGTGTGRSSGGPLRQVLGAIPERPQPQITIMETVDLPGGRRHKIEYLAEPRYEPFHEPADRVRAYLFEPSHTPGSRLPAIIAIHQDGPQSHLGKLETAGLAGDENLHYGLELFRQGYVVLCPDRVGHAERRRGVTPDSVNPDHDDELLNHRVGQLLLRGRTLFGKEAYDCMVAADVLLSLDYVDGAHLGGIGHSAGGEVLIFWMYLDPRVRVGVSSCGYFDLLRFFDENAPKRRLAMIALPGLALVGTSADYLAAIAPRPLMLTRGNWEWGRGGNEETWSREHVAETVRMVSVASESYKAMGSIENFKVKYFDEGGGNHAFPQGVRQDAYAWLKSHLKSFGISSSPAKLV